MFLTVHTTLGVIIGGALPSPVTAFAAGFVSHFVLDAIPHGDQELSEGKFIFSQKSMRLLRKLASADLLCVIVVHYLLYASGTVEYTLPVLLAMFASALPDFINALYLITKTRLLRWYYSFHYDLHYLWNGFVINFKQGLIVQALFLGIFLYFLLKP